MNNLAATFFGEDAGLGPNRTDTFCRVSVFGIGILPFRRKGFALRNLAEALHADGVGCTLSVDGELKMEIPTKSILCVLARSFQNNFGSTTTHQIWGPIKRMSRWKLEDKS